MRLTRDEFCALLEQALEDLPEQFAQHLADVSVEVCDVPDAETVRELGLSEKSDLLGLYRGHPLTDRSVSEAVSWPDRILIYQRNVERICRTRAEVVEQVRITVLHELGHHFGLDEDDLEELGYD